VIIDETFHQEYQLGNYDLTRVHHTDGHVLRVRIHRDFYGFQSYALVEVFTPGLTWTVLAKTPWTDWHEASPMQATDATPLTPIADRLIERARRILTAATPAPSA
jgi:hypothetical protein